MSPSRYLTEIFSEEDGKKIDKLASILRDKYQNNYQNILEGKKTKLLESLASRLDISEQSLIEALVYLETERIVKQLETHDNLKHLQDMVDRMACSP